MRVPFLLTCIAVSAAPVGGLKDDPTWERDKTAILGRAMHLVHSADLRTAVTHSGTEKHGAQQMDAYIIGPSDLYSSASSLVEKLGFSPQMVTPKGSESACRKDNLAGFDDMEQASDEAAKDRICMGAHQEAWGKIVESGRPAFVLETDATLCDAPIRQVQERLDSAIADARNMNDPVYISAGPGAVAYFLNPPAAAIGMKFDACRGLACKSNLGVGQKLSSRCTTDGGDVCSTCGPKDYFRCFSLPPIETVVHSSDCVGPGLLMQSRSLKASAHSPQIEKFLKSDFS